MGFLDHSANNIIVDAVLTSLGRKKLANNLETFKIAMFSLADDEIDYGIIERYGRTVGKEKIEKNTPVLEAFTNGKLSLKYKNLSLSNEFTSYMPKYTITTKNNDILKFSNGIISASLQLTIEMEKEGLAIPRDIRDRDIYLYLDNRFLYVDQPYDMLTSDNIAIYTLSTAANVKGFSLTLPIYKRSLDDTTFNLYSIANGNPAYIRSFVKIEGAYSGIIKIVEANIEKY